MSFSRRTITAIALCLVTLVTGALGLGSRKVLCMDGDGHYAIEAAGHAPHGGCHADDADHHRPVRPAGATDSGPGLDDRGDGACSDMTLANSSVQRETTGTGTARVLQPNIELPAWATSLSLTSPHLTSALLRASHSTDAPLRAELASLRGIILLS